MNAASQVLELLLYMNQRKIKIETKNGKNNYKLVEYLGIYRRLVSTPAHPEWTCKEKKHSESLFQVKEAGKKLRCYICMT